MFVDTKGVIRRRKSGKDSQYNDPPPKKKDTETKVCTTNTNPTKHRGEPHFLCKLNKINVFSS